MPVAIGTILFVDLLLVFARSGNAAVAGVMSFVAVILLVIVLHEFGHYVTAKSFGIKVTEFFVGFGPRLWSLRRGETEYGIKAIPAGGYVRIAGMNPFTEEPVEDQPRTFGAKPAWQRLVVLVAGVGMHFVLAMLLMTTYFAFIGTAEYGAVIERVEPRLEGAPSPASVAGLRPGDEIVAVDGRPVTYEQFIEHTRANVGDSIDVTVERGDRTLTLSVTPVLSEVQGERVGRLGVILSLGEVVRRNRVGLATAITESGEFIGTMTAQSFGAIGRVFGPEGIGRLFELLSGEERTIEDPIGVVGAGRLAGQAAAAGSFEGFFALFMSLNIFVGILNLLPLPPLDGGHVLLLGIEKARGGRAVDMRRVVPVMAVVAGFLIIYTLLLLYVDIRNPIPNPFGP